MHLCSQNLKWTQIITLSELHTKKNLKNQKSKIVQTQLKREREREREREKENYVKTVFVFPQLLKRRKKLPTHKDDKQTQPTTTTAKKYCSEQLVRFIHTFHKFDKKPYDKIIKDSLTTTTNKQINKQTSEQNANQ